MITLMSTIMIILSTQLYAGAMPSGVIAGSVAASTAAQMRAELKKIGIGRLLLKKLQKK